MRRRLAGLLLAALLLPLVPAPASAVQPLGDPQQVAPAGCLRSAVSTGPDGALRGFVQCRTADGSGAELRYVVRTSGGWQVRRVLPDGGVLWDSTQDATGTYVLYAGSGPVGAYVRRVSRDGTVGARRWLGPSSDRSGSVVARDGRWWAVWSAFDGSAYSLREAGTLFGSSVVDRRITSDTGDGTPSVQLRPGGGLQLAWPRVRYDAEGRATTDVRLASTTGSGWQSRSLAREPGLTGVRMTVAGRHTYLSWTRGLRPLVASNESGAFRTRVFLVPACAAAGHLAVSGSTVFLAWGGCNGRTGTQARDEVYLAERRSGTWSTATAFSGSAYELTDLVQSAGRATVAASHFSGDPGTYRSLTRTQR